jgi:hypothetical protein
MLLVKMMLDLPSGKQSNQRVNNAVPEEGQQHVHLVSCHKQTAHYSGLFFIPHSNCGLLPISDQAYNLINGGTHACGIRTSPFTSM